MSLTFTSLRVRLVVVMLLSCVGFFSAVAIVVNGEIRSALEARTRQSTRDQLASHAEVIADSVLVDDRIELRRDLLRILDTNPDWLALEVASGSGERLALVSREGTGENAPYVESAPLLDGRVGLLRARVSPRANRAAAAVALERTALVLGVLSLAGVASAALLAQWLARPLETIAERVREMGKGRFSGTVDVPPGQGEVSVVARALNETSQRLAAAWAEIDEHHRKMTEIEKLAAVGALAAGVAHEVLNPIAGASACVRRLGRPDLSAESREEHARLAGEALSRAGNVLSQLLSYARPAVPGAEDVEVGELVGDVARLVASGTGKRIDVADGPKTPVFWPRGPVQQAVTNLLLNAVQAAVSFVQVSWASDAENVRLEIEDDGPGIPPELMKRVFEPFFTTRPVGAGTGLGLSVSLSIALALGGWIELQSVPGRIGTLAIVTLPRRVACEVSRGP